MSEAAQCPALEQLRCLALELVDGEARTALESHVKTCPTCQGTLAVLSRDGQVRATGGSPLPAPRLPGLDDFLQRLKDRPPPELHIQAVDVHFPLPPTERGPLGQIECYHIESRRGRGGMGVVYRAYDERLGREVAIKVLRPELEDVPGHLERFGREARAASAVRHDHVVLIHHIGETPGFPQYLVMEYIHGESLSERLDRRRGERLPGVPPSEAAEIARQVALGLAAAHVRGLVHRDIKSSNIMLEQATGRAKITDFGLARPIAAGAAAITRAGHIVGTPVYMSPEQITDPDRIDGRSDIYSLGVVLYELLTGERPFRGTDADLLLQVIHDDPQPPRKLNQAVPRDLETITLKCLAKEPGRRYTTAAALADDLQRFLNGEAIRARPVGRFEKTWRWCRRNPATAAMLALAGVLLAVTLVAILHGQVQARQSAEDRAARADAEAARLESDTRAIQAEAARLRAETLPFLERAVTARAQGFYQAAAVFLAEALRHNDQPHLRLQWMETLQTALVARTTVPLPPGGLPENLPPLSMLALASTYSPVKDRLVTAGKTERLYLRAWDTATLREVWTDVADQPAPKLITAMAADPTGRFFAAVDEIGWLTIHDFDTGERVLTIPAHTKTFVLPAIPGINDRPGVAVSGLGWSLDGRRLASAGEDREIRIWDAESGRLLIEWKHEDIDYPGEARRLADTPSALGLGYAADGKQLITYGTDSLIRFWDLETKRITHRLTGHVRPVVAMSASPDGRLLASGTDDGQVVVWDFARRVPLQSVYLRRLGGAADAWRAYPPDLGDSDRDRLEQMRRWLDRGIISIDFSPDGNWLVVVLGDGSVSLVDRATGEPTYRGLAHRSDQVGHSWVTAYFSLRGDLLTVGNDGTLRQWDLPSWSVGRRVLHPSRPAERIEVAADGQSWLLRLEEGRLVHWGIETNEENSVPRVPGDSYMTFAGRAAQQKDERLVVATYRGRNLVVHQKTGAILTEFKGPAGDREPYDPAKLPGRLVPVVALHPSGELAASTWIDGSVDVWHTGDGKPVHRLTGPGGGVHGIAFRPDGAQLAVSRFDGTLEVFAVETGALQYRKSGPQQARALTYSPDGRQLVQCGLGSRVAVWDASTGDRVAALAGHLPSAISHEVQMVLIWAAAYSRDGRWLATGSADGTVRLWDARESYGLVAVLSTNEVRSMCTRPARRAGQLLPPSWRTAIRALAFSPDGRQLVVAGYEGPLRTYDVPAVMEALRKPPSELLADTERLTGLHLQNDTLTPRRPVAGSNGGPPAVHE